MKDFVLPSVGRLVAALEEACRWKHANLFRRFYAMQERVWIKFTELSAHGEPPLPHQSQLHALFYVFISQHKPFLFRMYFKPFKRAPTLEELLEYWTRVQKLYKLSS